MGRRSPLRIITICALTICALSTIGSVVPAGAVTKKTVKTVKKPSRATTTLKRRTVPPTTRRTITTAAPAPATVPPAPTTLPATTTVAPTTTKPAPAFSFASALLTAAVPVSTTVTIPIWINNDPGFLGDVALSATDVPDAVRITFDPASARNYAVASITVLSGTGALPVLTIVGRSGALVRTTRLAVFVPDTPATATTVAGAVPAVALAAAQPATPLVRNGVTGAYLVTVSRSGGFAGPVTLSVPGPLPTGVFTSFSTNPVSGTDSTLFVTVTNLATVGQVPIEIVATSGTGTVRLTLVITVA